MRISGHKISHHKAHPCYRQGILPSWLDSTRVPLFSRESVGKILVRTCLIKAETDIVDQSALLVFFFAHEPCFGGQRDWKALERQQT